MDKTENVSLTQTNDDQYRDIFICDCYSTEHQMVFHYMIEKDEDSFPERHELHYEVHLTTYKSFWKRLWYGLKYAFGYKSKYGDWDNFIFNPDDADKMIKYLTMLKKNHDDVEKKMKENLNKIRNGN